MGEGWLLACCGLAPCALAGREEPAQDAPVSERRDVSWLCGQFHFMLLILISPSVNLERHQLSRLDRSSGKCPLPCWRCSPYSPR